MPKYVIILLAFILTAYGEDGGSGEAQQLIQAAEGGDAEAQLHLAWAYNANPDNSYEDKVRISGIPNDETKAAYWFQKSAEQGNSVAQICLGDAYSFGNGVAKDFKKSLYWYRKAAAQNNPNANNRIEGLRIILESPVRTDEDKQAVQAAFDAEKTASKEKAISASLQQQAQAGDPLASRRLGERYWDGVGISKDRIIGLKLLRFAAEHDDREAQAFLGAIYANGVGVAQDFAEAIKWNKEAAEKGDAVAQYNLALEYLKGQGVLANLQEGRMWLEKSAAQGNAGAKQLLTEIKLDESNASH